VSDCSTRHRSGPLSSMSLPTASSSRVCNVPSCQRILTERRGRRTIRAATDRSATEPTRRFAQSRPSTGTARRATISRQAEPSVFHAVAECLPLIWRGDLHRTLLVFRVADAHDTWQVGGHFHAVAAVIAAQLRLAPPDIGQIHFSSATFMIISRDRRCVRLSERSAERRRSIRLGRQRWLPLCC
jgi:hypothetical protein